ncbi:MAG: ATP-binding cassette domain-containing protein [Gammaproteobacteria bacterium]|nr:ATP-binding cassette domain-containing protein [Gammaproteobacteria bacterium]
MPRDDGVGRRDDAAPEAGATPHAVISARGIESRFGSTVVHVNLDLDVRRGEILGIVGGSGSGKSVLMRTLAGLRAPQAGEVRLLGEPLHGLSRNRAMAIRQRVGVMFQGGALFSSLDVLANVSFPMQKHTALGARAITALARMKLSMVGLSPEAEHRAPQALSGGMVKRVALARAMALDPEVLFLDEPSAGLDPVGAAALDDLILSLAGDLGLTICLISHDLDSLWRVTDRVAFLAEKRIVAVEPMRRLSEHAHPEIKAYFAGPRAQAAKERAWNSR